jgi:type I restriction enzyme S subunit
MDIADICVSNVDKKVLASEKRVKLCNYMDVYSNDYVTSRLDFMEGSASAAEIERFALKCGDVVITKDSETPDDIGIPAVIAEAIDRLVCGYHLALIRPHSDELDSVYLAKQLSTSRVARYFAIQASGSTRYGLPISAIESVSIPTPPMPEQSKIAEILSTVDRGIEQTEALIAKQQRIKSGLMQDLLTRGIDEHGNLRSESTHEFKDSPLGRIPVEWTVEEISAKALVKGGKRLPAGHAYAESDTGYRYLQTTDFISKRLNYYSLHHLFKDTFRALERYEITDGDIFVSIAGVNLGVAGVLRPDFRDRVILTENAAKVHLLTDDYPEYISAQINSHTVQAQIIEDKGIGAGVPKLALFRIRQFLVPWPSREEQLQIVHRLQSLNGCLQNFNVGLWKLLLLRTALLQDLLTGEKRVTPLLELELTH